MTPPKLVLTIAGRPMSANDRKHWRDRAKQTADLRALAALEARAQWGPRDEWPALRYPVTIVVQDECRTARLRDVAQCAPAVKAIIDGLTDAGLWPDDSAKWVGDVRFLPPRKTGRDGLTLTIYDHEGDS